MIYDVIVVGAGASGMMAAITAAQNGNTVLLADRMPKLGKKILATGNGRCNLSNRYLDGNCYRGSHPSFAYPLIEKFGTDETVDFFESIGVMITEKDGYLYPSSMQAQTIVDAMTEKISSLSIDVAAPLEIQTVSKKEDIFTVTGRDVSFQGYHLILATGGKAQEQLGSNGSGYKLAKMFSHPVTDVFPCLTALEANGSYFKWIAGVRNVCRISAYSNGHLMAEETGEVQFTKYGISGIPVFQISRYAIDAMHRRKKVTVILNLMPHCITLKELLIHMKNQCPYKTCSELLSGLMNHKLALMILEELGIPKKKSVLQVIDDRWEDVADLIQNFKILLTGFKGFDMAQATAGGVSTRKMIPQTLESAMIRGLFFTGELLDVDGTCGGYNLQWAFTSGHIAGDQIVPQQKQKSKGRLL